MTAGKTAKDAGVTRLVVSEPGATGEQEDI